MTLGIEELEAVRQNLITESSNALATHHKALGAIELLDYLIGELQAEPDNGTGSNIDSGRESSDNAQEIVRDISDSSGRRVKSPDGTADSRPV